MRVLSRRLPGRAGVALPNTAARLGLFCVVSGLKSGPRNRWNWSISQSYLCFQFLLIAELKVSTKSFRVTSTILLRKPGSMFRGQWLTFCRLFGSSGRSRVAVLSPTHTSPAKG